MKKLLLSLLLLTGCLPLAAYPKHSPELTQLVQTLYRFEDTKQLLAQAEEEGPFTIRTAKMGQQAPEASWMVYPRLISINTSYYRSYGSMITSLVFELHNVLSTKQFDDYDQLALSGKINREQFIRGIEEIEYSNARKTSYLLWKGVQQGLFPRDAAMPIPHNFEDHFRLQLDSGHSSLIGSMYDDLMREGSGNLADNG